MPALAFGATMMGPTRWRSNSSFRISANWLMKPPHEPHRFRHSDSLYLAPDPQCRSEFDQRDPAGYRLFFHSVAACRPAPTLHGGSVWGVLTVSNLLSDL